MQKTRHYKEVEVMIGDEWFMVPQHILTSFLGVVEAEQIEKRLHRPLQTVVGRREFLDN